MKVENVSKRLKDVLIFEQVHLNFEKGKIYSIFGRNGSGKTTLLNILNGNLSPDTGSVTGNEEAIFLESNDVPFGFMTADEFIHQTFRFKGVPLDVAEKAFYYDRLYFHPGSKRIKDFSKGMKSKLYLIIALLSKSSVWLLDEPFTDIDPVSFEAIMTILKEYKHERIIVFSTHQAQIAYELSDEILYLSKKGLTLFSNQYHSAKALEEAVLESMKVDGETI
ncbi:ATP-binding cassette domain-containing protein [Streptococcus sp. DD13]|uniref:ATP-binding cassette domain-containing protein n=1 Tax=Streptococcus sp. DD13 TaxID=1777881 RepID=UPI000799875C|nr:ABC transporter ATP-binding protein [Streptococcus sp. DD13]KXT77829.1 ABC transporter ATP-binding protein [Streptococcus sp. DD13]